MSKTFEPKTFDTAHHDNKILKVDVLFDNPRLLIKDFVGDNRGFAFEPSDAPALALAILEAAGVKDTSTGGLITPDRVAMTNLQIHIETQERITAEAETKAKLEAEALELRNAFSSEHSKCESFDEIESPDDWLAVARRAREINKETPNA